MKQYTANAGQAAGIPKRIWVTGANGQVGNEFRDLVGRYPQFEFLFTSKEELPIQDEQKVKTFLALNSPDYCINCGAYTAVDKAEEEKELAFVINGDAVGVVATACKATGCRLVHISTDYVFDGEGKSPYKEIDPVDPLNVYGASKLKGEQLAMQADPATIIIRSSWIYSAHGKNFVKTMLRLMKDRPEISVVSDQVGSPTYAADLAEAIMQIIVAGNWQGGIYHYANEGVISWYEFAEAIRDEGGSNCRVVPISSTQYPTPAKRPRYSVFDTSKIQTTFGIRVKDWRTSLGICMKRLGRNG